MDRIWDKVTTPIRTLRSLTKNALQNPQLQISKKSHPLKSLKSLKMRINWLVRIPYAQTIQCVYYLPYILGSLGGKYM